MRIDKDLLGEVRLPDSVYYGAQTERARLLVNPSYDKLRDYPELIRALVLIKLSAARAHRQIGTLDAEISAAMEQACMEILQGNLAEHFVVDLFQGGGGVGVHMNVNEVVAGRASEILTGSMGSGRVHPNTHVNMGQSTNDVLPAAIKMAFHAKLGEVIQAGDEVLAALQTKARELDPVVKLSRTCIQDAVPIRMGQVFSGYAHMVARRLTELRRVRDTLVALPLGGTAVGTGLGVFAGYVPLVYQQLQALTGVPWQPEANFFDGLQNADYAIDVSASLKALSCGLSKIGRDFRLLSSGPRGGLGEIQLEAVQNGSSIMPGKVNPALPELMNMLAYQVCGHDAAVTMAAEAGDLDLNVWEGIFAINILASCRLLIACMPVFARRCVATLSVNREVCARGAEESLALSMVVSAMFGYAKGAEVAERAVADNISIKRAVVVMGLLTEEEAARVLDPLMLTDSAESGALLLSLHKA